MTQQLPGERYGQTRVLEEEHEQKDDVDPPSAGRVKRRHNNEKCAAEPDEYNHQN